MTATPPPSTGLRTAVERRSAPVLAWLSVRPPYVLPVGVVLLLVAGLAAPPLVGAPLLLLLGLLLLWLSFLSWPVLDSGARLLRTAMLALVLLAVVQRVAA